jgi:acylphosphatase
MMSETAALLRIEGRVQGVGFRAWAAVEARRRSQPARLGAQPP